MAEDKNAAGFCWVRPEERGILPLGKLHISRSLKRYVKSNSIELTINTHFKEVVKSCADRPVTWINEELFEIYLMLFEKRHASSIEIWQNEELIGGLFGIAIGSCFCGESMFSAKVNGSKIALIVTMALLVYNKFKLFDTQFPSNHLKSMGGCTISQIEYERLLSLSLGDHRTIDTFPRDYSWSSIMQLTNHKL